MSDADSIRQDSLPTVTQQAVAFAEAEARAGAGEVGGDNAGPFVEKYLNANHPERITHRGEPWCVAFYCWCWLQAARSAGTELPVSFTRSAHQLWGWLAAHGQVLTRAQALAQKEPGGPEVSFRPAPGDAVFWDFSGNGEPDHVNMLHHIDADGTIHTIGGNEGNEESGAPVRVKRRGLLEELGRVLGFGRMYRSP